MKRLCFLAFLILSFIFSFGQGTPFPTYQQFGSPTTRTNFLGAIHAQKGIINGRYADTATANLGSIDFYPGAKIITDNPLDIEWLRNSDATRWIQAASNITNITNITESLTDCYGILNGGVVSWSELLIFDISPADYVIN